MTQRTPRARTPRPGAPLARIRHVYRGVGVLLLNTVLLGACLEMAAWGVRAQLVPTLLALPPPPPALQTSGYYATVPWAAAYWEEHGRSDTQRYHPYVGWRHAPFAGTHITVDAHGVRVTPGGDCADATPPADATRPVFFFGSSVMWGAGAPGWSTIPAYVQRLLLNHHVPICVRNFAEFGYVSTQDVLTLQAELLAGHVPAVAVMYALHDDIYMAWHYGQAGLPARSRRMARMFEVPAPPSPLQWAVNVLSLSHAYALTRRGIERLSVTPPAREDTPLERQRVDPVAQAKLAREVVRHYLANVALVRALSVQYGFAALFVVPPHLFLAPGPLTPAEEGLQAKATTDDVALADLTRMVMTQLRQAWVEAPQLTALMPVVRHTGGPQELPWLDAGHTTPVGNERIAAALVEALHPVLQPPKTTSLPTDETRPCCHMSVSGP